MIDVLRVTILADNSVCVPGLIAEQGLSMLIEADRYRLLFDTGQGGAFLKNAQTLGCDLGSLDAIVISHGHYDHTGGLADALRLDGQPRIFLHPAALNQRFLRRGTASARSIGMSPQSRQAVDKARDRLVRTRSSVGIVPGVWCTGEIPRSEPPGIDNGPFFLDAACREPDPLLDDQALFIQTAKGIVVLAGCTHAGVVNTLDFINRRTARNEIFGVIGGLHLKGAPPTAWDAAGDAFDQRDVELIAPCHCTGPDAWTHLYSRFGDRVLSCRWRLAALAVLPGCMRTLVSEEDRENAEQRERNMSFPSLTLQPIGMIETPFQEPAGTPIQPSRAKGTAGRVHVQESFREGLRDLEGFERIWLIYCLHKSGSGNLLVTPFLDTEKRGVFATRAPSCPSPIRISAVRLVKVRGTILDIAEVDILDGTPLLDIKPYVPEFDCYAGSRAGWFSSSESDLRVADDRFSDGSP